MFREFLEFLLTADAAIIALLLTLILVVAVVGRKMYRRMPATIRWNAEERANALEIQRVLAILKSADTDLCGKLVGYSRNLVATTLISRMAVTQKHLDELQGTYAHGLTYSSQHASDRKARIEELEAEYARLDALAVELAKPVIDVV